MNKDKLLPIGQLAKMTGVSIKSLRYYEKTGVLIPVYVDPDSKYRYYDTHQLLLVQLITFYVELDIPISQLKPFLAPDKQIDLISLIDHAHNEANQKLEKINSFLNHFDALKDSLIANSKLVFNQVKKMNNIHKKLVLEPLKSVLSNHATNDDIAATIAEAASIIRKMQVRCDDKGSIDGGVMQKHLNGVTTAYAFLEVNADYPLDDYIVIELKSCYQYYLKTSQYDAVFDTIIKENDNYLYLSTLVLAPSFDPYEYITNCLISKLD